MSKENYISVLDVDLQKIIDYVFQNISKNEEILMERFLDDNEELAATIEDLLDFCLINQFDQHMIQYLLKTGQSSNFNDILNDIQYCLDEIKKQEPAKSVIDSFTHEQNPILKWLNIGTKIFNKTITKSLFTLLLVLNFWQTGGDYSNSNLLKASQKEEVKEMMILTNYQIQYMRVDMLDDRPITDFITDVAIPSNFEMHYFTED